MTTGSLFEQILYPADADSISGEERRELLSWLGSTVEDLGLSELILRCGGLDVDPGWSDWSDSLSSGETQRVAFARLLSVARRRPLDVAFLDEATSALPVNTEEQLYRRLLATGATVVSVGHREGLRKFHSAVLRLGEDEIGGWSLQDIGAVEE